jgi:hypothetical protein
MNLVGATFAVACVTLVVAVGSLWSARELWKSRQLDWAPYLTFQLSPGDEPQGGYTHFTAKVTNIGRGRAINCTLARRFTPNVWQQSGMFDLGNGEAHVAPSPQQNGAMPEFLAQGGNARTLLMCQDLSGTCHMFDPPRPPGISRWAFRQPAWAKWYRAQITAAG